MDFKQVSRASGRRTGAPPRLSLLAALTIRRDRRPQISRDPMILKAPASRHSNDEGVRRAAAEGPSSGFVSAGDALQREAVRLEMEDQLMTPHQTRHAMHRPNHPANRCEH